ncbi:MAG: hypothetical protein WCW26_01710 [Candidatus Buchananbacteria bacterium]
MAYPMTTKINKVADQMPGSDVSAGLGKKGKRGSWLKGLITLIVVLVIICGGIYLIISYTGVGGNLFSATQLRGSWQAVFLTNGQVYFGKVAKIDKDSVILKDIYYLQVVTKPLQQSQGGDTTAQADQQQEQRLTLIKLGNEIHGPKDEMIINRSHVVLMEDLKDDSRVVQAISDYVASQNKK